MFIKDLDISLHIMPKTCLKLVEFTVEGNKIIHIEKMNKRVQRSDFLKT